MLVVNNSFLRLGSCRVKQRQQENGFLICVSTDCAAKLWKLKQIILHRKSRGMEIGRTLLFSAVLPFPRTLLLCTLLTPTHQKINSLRNNYK